MQGHVQRGSSEDIGIASVNIRYVISMSGYRPVESESLHCLWNCIRDNRESMNFVIHRRWRCQMWVALSFVATDEVLDSRALSGTLGRDVDDRPRIPVQMHILPCTVPQYPTFAGRLRQLHLQRQRPRWAQPGATKQPGGHVKSPHSPTPTMFSAKYDDDGVTRFERAPAVDSSG